MSALSAAPRTLPIRLILGGIDLRYSWQEIGNGDLGFVEVVGLFRVFRYVVE